MAQRTPSSVLAMALLIGGCPHPQTGPRIVYVPSAPPQAKPPTAASVDSQVIEEPPPPAEPEVEVAPEEPSASKPPRPRRRPVTGEPPVQTEPAPESPEPASAEVPPLAHSVPPGVPGIILQTPLQNGLIISDVPGPTGGILIKSTTGAFILVNDVGIIIQNGKGASIVMQGPTTVINQGSLVVL